MALTKLAYVQNTMYIFQKTYQFFRLDKDYDQKNFQDLRQSPYRASTTLHEPGHSAGEEGLGLIFFHKGYGPNTTLSPFSTVPPPEQIWIKQFLLASINYNRSHKKKNIFSGLVFRRLLVQLFFTTRLRTRSFICLCIFFTLAQTVLISKVAILERADGLVSRASAPGLCHAE